MQVARALQRRLCTAQVPALCAMQFGANRELVFASAGIQCIDRVLAGIECKYPTTLTRGGDRQVSQSTTEVDHRAPQIRQDGGFKWVEFPVRRLRFDGQTECRKSRLNGLKGAA